jgi:hypothetical protein
MSETKSSAWDRESLNVVLLAVWSLVEALQLMVIAVFIFSFIPIKPNPFVQTLFPLHQKGVLPEREMLFYRIFVLGAIALQAGVLKIFYPRLKDDKFGGSVIALTAVNVFWLFLQIFAVFKMIVVDVEPWMRGLLYVSLTGAVVTRIFWPEVLMWGGRLYRSVVQMEPSQAWRIAVDIAFPVLVAFLLFVPDLDKVLARMFYRDQFYHLDSLLAAPGWAHLNGLTLNRDVISEYSVTMPIVVSHLARLIGGFNYHNLVVILIGVTIAYYIGLYFLLRRWLGSILIAAFGVLLAIKLQMFHWGVSPLIWQFPSATVIRYCFDLMALYLLWRHCSTGNGRYLWWAAAACGIALGYMFDTGIYLTVTLYAYLAVLLIHPAWRKETFPSRRAVRVAGLLGLPLVTGFLVLGLVQGPTILSREFWVNAFEFASLFLQGWGSLPMFDGLRERQFFAFFMGFVIPVVYVWTMIFVGALCFLRQIERKNLFVLILCVYGLGLYQYFINRSAVSSYYVVCIPFVCIICFWLTHLSEVFGARWRRALRLVALVAVFCALLTSYLFTYYPNALNLAGMDWGPEKKFYKEEFNFSQDAALIDGLTAPDERVALVSSFETAILIEAKRKPFFYYFPLIESTHMRAAEFRGTYLHTIDRMKKTLLQLEGSKPGYVFIERKLFDHQIPAEYYQYYQTLNILVQYLNAHYTVVDQGKYLTALKRK